MHDIHNHDAEAGEDRRLTVAEARKRAADDAKAAEEAEVRAKTALEAAAEQAITI